MRLIIQDPEETSKNLKILVCFYWFVEHGSISSALLFQVARNGWFLQGYGDGSFTCLTISSDSVWLGFMFSISIN